MQSFWLDPTETNGVVNPLLGVMSDGISDGMFALEMAPPTPRISMDHKDAQTTIQSTVLSSPSSVLSTLASITSASVSSVTTQSTSNSNPHDSEPLSIHVDPFDASADQKHDIQKVGAADPHVASATKTETKGLDDYNYTVQHLSAADVLRLAEPLDLVLFHGGDLVSKVICIGEQYATDHDEFSHCGVVVTHELMPFVTGMLPGKKYVWESSFSGTIAGIYTVQPKNIDNPKGSFTLGVQIRELEQLIPSYLAVKDSALALGKLQHNPWTMLALPAKPQTTTTTASSTAATSDSDIKTASVQQIVALHAQRTAISATMLQLHNELAGRLYDANACDFCAIFFRCCRPERQLFDYVTLKIDNVVHRILTSMNVLKADTSQIGSILDPSSWVFCSQMAAMIYESLGIMAGKNKLRPIDVLPVELMTLCSTICYVDPSSPPLAGSNKSIRAVSNRPTTTATTTTDLTTIDLSIKPPIFVPTPTTT